MMIVKFCRVCGRAFRAKPGSPHSKTCSCGGKLVQNPEESANARRRFARQQQTAIQAEIAQIDAEIHTIEEGLKVEGD